MRRIVTNVGSSSINSESQDLTLNAVNFRHADGHAQLSVGQTRVVAAVYGPMDAQKMQSLNIQAVSMDKDSANSSACSIGVQISVASYASMEGQQSTHGRKRIDKKLQEMTVLLRQTFLPIVQCHLYPRSAIQIHLHILQLDGSLLAAALNCCTLALIDAGVAMSDYVCAASAGLVTSSNSDSVALLDLSGSEETSGADIPKFTVAITARTQRVALLHIEQRMHQSKFDAVHEMALNGAEQVHSVLDAAVKRSVVIRAQQHQNSESVEKGHQ